jgi:hypothetical protein
VGGEKDKQAASTLAHIKKLLRIEAGGTIRQQNPPAAVFTFLSDFVRMLREDFGH